MKCLPPNEGTLWPTGEPLEVGDNVSSNSDDSDGYSNISGTLSTNESFIWKKKTVINKFVCYFFMALNKK